MATFDHVVKLVSSNSDEVANAVAELSCIAAEAFGLDASRLAANVRESGGLDVLVACMDDPSDEVQQCAMSLLGNLLTDVFDPEARLSLAEFSEADGLKSLQQKLLAEFPINLYAAACLQNVTALDPQHCCAELRSRGCADVLSQLLDGGDDRVRVPSHRVTACSLHTS